MGALAGLYIGLVVGAGGVYLWWRSDASRADLQRQINKQNQELWALKSSIAKFAEGGERSLSPERIIT